MEQQPSHDEIRQMVRTLLREVMPQARNRRGGGVETNAFSGRVRDALGNGGGVEVSLGTDPELNDFARAVALCAMERDLLGAIASNRVRFHLAKSGSDTAAALAKPRPEGATDSVCHWETGLLNETKITEIGRTHRRLIVGPKAVLTPLARDRAREIKLEIVRKRK